MAIEEYCGQRKVKKTKGRGPSTSTSSQVPKPGAVDMLYSGLPGHDAKNGLVAVALSFVEVYRPKVLLLELSGSQDDDEFPGDSAAILKFVVRLLVTLGYQATWTIAQAGSFGCPQNRRRPLVLATLPHIKLTSWPTATHLFTKHSIAIRAGNNDLDELWRRIHWFRSTTAALFPPSTVSDITDDLPAFDWQSPNEIMKHPPAKLAKLRSPAASDDAGPVPQVVAVHPKSRTIASCGPKKPVYATEPRSELQRLLRRIQHPSTKKDRRLRSRVYDWLGIETHFTAPSDEIHEYRAARAFAKPVLNHVNRTYSADVVERVCNVSRDKAPFDFRVLPKALVVGHGKGGSRARMAGWMQWGSWRRLLQIRILRASSGYDYFGSCFASTLSRS
ncbi:hypothetical protein BCR44DRAFT_1146971 [Catenaria anguillulae PL171]|uniref:DNA (cytosine-5-)-methyltransferase n=1 Tax=Catenaria anguillulae PL171 TaxID=765915 RepID=A0A1Y2HJ19_9FUNG|nr:hypothetical protein BCR44DRAFT_1146971 [Catenaria anguillulae PL171]